MPKNHIALCLISSLFVISTINIEDVSAVQTQQSDEKVIEWKRFPDEPFEIDNLSVKNVRIALHEKFSARQIAAIGGGQSEDWLENLEFTIRNRSDKQITYLAVSFQFPLYETGGLYYHRVFGVDLRASGEVATYAKPFALRAGDTFTLTLSVEDLTKIKKLLSHTKTRLADMNKVIIQIPKVGYEDGMQWERGKYSRPEKLRRKDEKIIERQILDDEPYDISNLKVKGIAIESQEPYRWYGASGIRHKFNSSEIVRTGGGQVEDWLDGFTFTFKNSSDKTVTYIIFQFGFPETQVSGAEMVYDTSIGIAREGGRKSPNPVEPLSLEADETVSVTLSAQHLNAIRDFLALRKFQLADLNKMTIRVAYIVYTDGSRWIYGNRNQRGSDTSNGSNRIRQ